METLFSKGGFMIYPIFICSIFALAVIVERTYLLFRLKYTPDKLFQQVLAHLKSGRIRKAESLLAESGTSFYDLYDSILSENCEKEREKAALNMGGEWIDRLEKRLPLLSTIVSVTPIMGLLGTVFGMIEVFSDVARLASAADISVLAGGIWQALLTTAAGLSVAIPSLIAYRLLQGKISRIVSSMQRKCNLLISAIGGAENDTV